MDNVSSTKTNLWNETWAEEVSIVALRETEFDYPE